MIAKFMVDDTEVHFYSGYHWADRSRSCPIAALVDFSDPEMKSIYLGCDPFKGCPILPFEVDIINNFGDEKDA